MLLTRKERPRLSPPDLEVAPIPSVSRQLVDTLTRLGVDTVFGIPGGTISRLYAELAQQSAIRVHHVVQESHAVYLAMGHALATGRPALVLVTSGPGLTNALTGIASAHADGIPVLVIAGEVATTAFGRGALQEGSPHGCDAVALARPVTRFAARLVRPAAAVGTLLSEWSSMHNGRRGPAFLSLPIDVGNVELAAPVLRADPVPAAPAPDAAACGRVADLLATAQRPFLLLGAAGRDAAVRDAAAALAERAQCPVAVTPKGKGGFAEDSPLFLGVLGFGGHDSVIDYLRSGVDVVLVVGSSLDDLATNAWSDALRPSTAFVQIDLDPQAFGRNYEVDLGIVGEASAALRCIGARLARPLPRRAPVAPRRQQLGGSRAGLLTTPQVIEAMNAECPPDAVFTADIGEHLAMALHYLRPATPGSFFTSLGFAAMGSGVVSAIGHALGAPQRRVFAICGDGGFLMAGLELQSAARLQVPVTFVIINDAAFNMCKHGLRDQYGIAVDCSLAPVDFTAVAAGFGVRARVVRDEDALRQGLRLGGGPVVLDVRTDPDVRLDGSQRIAALRQFSSDSRSQDRADPALRSQS